MGVMGQANRKLTEREKGCGGTIKSGEATGSDGSTSGKIVKQSGFNYVEEFQKRWTEASVSACLLTDAD